MILQPGQENSINSRPRDYVVLTRPYSWLDMVFTGILAYSIVTVGKLDVIRSLWIAVLCLLLWALLNWFSERIQQDEGRIRPDLRVIMIALLVSIILTVIPRPSSLIILLVYLISAGIYPLKKTNKYLGRVSFLVRGFHTLSLFYLAASLYTPLSGLLSSRRLLIMGLSLFLLQSSRSLVADIRDMGHDVCEFPASFGAPVSFVAAGALFALPMMLLPLSAYASLLPLIIASLFFLWAFRKRSPVAAHFIHRMFVFSLAVFKMALSFQISGTTLLLVMIIIVAGLLNMTYLMVARPSNIPVLEVLLGRVRISHLPESARNQMD